jgi:hypothetical protein
MSVFLVVGNLYTLKECAEILHGKPVNNLDSMDVTQYFYRHGMRAPSAAIPMDIFSVFELNFDQQVTLYGTPMEGHCYVIGIIIHQRWLEDMPLLFFEEYLASIQPHITAAVALCKEQYMYTSQADSQQLDMEFQVQQQLTDFLDQDTLSVVLQYIHVKADPQLLEVSA